MFATKNTARLQDTEYKITEILFTISGIFRIVGILVT